MPDIQPDRDYLIKKIIEEKVQWRQMIDGDIKFKYVRVDCVGGEVAKELPIIITVAIDEMTERLWKNFARNMVELCEARLQTQLERKV